MNIKLLDENTYERLNDKGEQIGQVSITQEMRDEAKKRRMGIDRYISSVLEKVRIERPILSQPVEGEEVTVVPAHEHEYDERYSAFDHGHDYHDHDYAAPDHGHDEFLLFKNAIEAESQHRYEADSNTHALLADHKHPELAQTFHTHDDVYASLNVLRGMVTAVEASIPKEIQPHIHNDLVEAINLIRSELHGLRQEVTSLGSRIDAEALTTRALIDQRTEDLQPKGAYLTREEMNPDTLHKRTYRVKVKSKQNVSGDDFMTLEEV